MFHARYGSGEAPLAMLHCHSSLFASRPASWPEMLCITPRLWKTTRSPSRHRCAYTVSGDSARFCKVRQMRLTSARSEIVVVVFVVGSRVWRARTQQPAICRLGALVVGVCHTIYGKHVNGRMFSILDSSDVRRGRMSLREKSALSLARKPGARFLLSRGRRARCSGRRR